MNQESEFTDAVFKINNGVNKFTVKLFEFNNSVNENRKMQN